MKNRPWLSDEDNAYFDYIDEWEKTQKEFLIDFDSIKKLPDGTILICGRVGHDSIKVGDKMGYAKVLKILAYQKELPDTGAGLTCGILFDKMPYLTVLESTPEYHEWLKSRNG